MRGRCAILFGSASVVSFALACGLSVEGSNETVIGDAEAGSTDAPSGVDGTSDGGGDAADAEVDQDADASEPLTGFCATHPNAFLCDDFDRGTLSKWDGVQTTNGNTVVLSGAQSKTPPSSILVNTFDSPDSGAVATCDKAALYKIFTLDFQEAELSFDIHPTSATGRSVAAALFLSDLTSSSYQIEVAVGEDAFIRETEASIPTQTPFAGDLLPNTWTRVTIRYSRSPSRVAVLYDNVLKHEKPLASAAYTTNHRLYVGDFCARQARSVHIDNVVFEKLR